MSDSLFGTSLRRDPNQPADLSARIDAQLRERLEEAVDFVCLGALVQRRRALALPPPSADNTRDREEFTQSVHAFLVELQATIVPGLEEAARRKVAAAEQAPGDEMQRLLGVHVVLARELPDYWQRFETAGTAFTAARASSGRERGGLLGWLFGRD
jgi:hypothetical protein